MLKTTGLPSGLTSEKNNGGKPASGGNYNNGKVDGFDIGGSDDSLNQKIV